MKNRMRSLGLLGLFSLGWFATGCATHTGEAVLTGSLLGAGTGAIIGSTSGNAGWGAVIGAGSGALLGGLVGNAYDAYDAGYARGRAEDRGYAPPPPAYGPGGYDYDQYYRPSAYRPAHSYTYYERHTYYGPPAWGYRYNHYCR